MSCQLNGNSADIPDSCNAAGTSYQDKNYSANVPPPFVSGWMYVNEHGQMCGPYIQEQLYQGLSTGFLPEELHVYPVVNGRLINPVPLNYFKQFPDHVATGFAYLHGTTMPASRSPSFSMSLAGHRQEGHVQYAAPVSICPDAQLVSQSQIHYNQPILNSDVANCVAQFSRMVLLLFSQMLLLSLVVFIFIVIISCSQVKILVGCLRMRKEGNMGHIPFWNFFLGIAMDISGIH